MNSYKSIEKLMSRPLRRTRADYASAYDNVVAVFRFIDEQDRTNHCKILSILYDVKSKQFTYDGIAALMHISDNALRRYRRNYVKWFCYFLELERRKTAAAC